MKEENFTWNEIKGKIVFCRSWVNKMEQEGLLVIKAKKGKGRVPRLFSHAEINRLNKIAVLRMAGVSLGDIKKKYDALEKFEIPLIMISRFARLLEEQKELRRQIYELLFSKS